MNTFANRKAKIEFLKGLANGVRSIKEVIPAEEVITPQTAEFWDLNDGLYTDNTGAALTEAEFIARPKRNAGIRHTVIFMDYSK